jgi:hypothetical protein
VRNIGLDVNRRDGPLCRCIPVVEWSANLPLPDYFRIACHPFRISNLFAASLVSTRQLSAGDPGEVRFRRLHRTCTA